MHFKDAARPLSIREMYRRPVCPERNLIGRKYGMNFDQRYKRYKPECNNAGICKSQ